MEWLLAIAAAAGGSFILALGILYYSAQREQRNIEALIAQLPPRIPPDTRGRPVLFHGVDVDHLPGPVPRYFHWSMDEGVELCNAVQLKMRGRIRLGRGKEWEPLESEETLAAGWGFVWRARTGGAISVEGFDRYSAGSGEMSWRLWGILPAMHGRGLEITRSARWRFAAEHLLLPPSLLPSNEVQWGAIDNHTALLAVNVEGTIHHMQLTVDPDGMPRKLFMQRWGNVETPGAIWQPIPYVVRFEGVFRKSGYSLPHQMSASWWAGTDKELATVELEIDDAEFL